MGLSSIDGEPDLFGCLCYGMGHVFVETVSHREEKSLLSEPEACSGFVCGQHGPCDDAWQVGHQQCARYDWNGFGISGRQTLCGSGDIAFFLESGSGGEYGAVGAHHSENYQWGVVCLVYRKDRGMESIYP